MANPWFRLYSEFSHDPKVQMLSEAMQRRLVMLMCLRCSNALETLRETELAFHLRISTEELAETKQLFIEQGFIDEHWHLPNWDKRQNEVSNTTKRVREWREKQKHNRNADETLPKRSGNTLDKNRTDKNRREEKKEKQAPVATAPAFRLPDWISDESWNRFEEMRKRIRCPLTDGARHLIVKELGALQRLGHPPDEVLNQSVMRGWRGVFELKKEYRNGQAGNGSQTGRTNPAIERRAISRESIRSVAAERYGLGPVANDGRGPGGVPEPDPPPGHGQDVPEPVGADGAEVRDRPFPGRTLEGNPQK